MRCSLHVVPHVHTVISSLAPSPSVSTRQKWGDRSSRKAAIACLVRTGRCSQDSGVEVHHSDQNADNTPDIDSPSRGTFAALVLGVLYCGAVHHTRQNAHPLSGNVFADTPLTCALEQWA